MSNPLTTNSLINWVNSLPDFLIIIIFILGILLAYFGGKSFFKENFKKWELSLFIIANIIIAGVLIYTMNKPLIIVQTFLLIESAELQNNSINYNPIIVLICYIGILIFSLKSSIDLLNGLIISGTILGIITYILASENKILRNKKNNDEIKNN